MVTRDKFKTYKGVFDNLTINALNKLRGNGFFNELIGPIKTGKEGDVYLAESDEGLVAVKIYRINTRMYQDIDKFITGDPRFKGLRRNPRQIIYAWTSKEFKNLLRAERVARVPEAMGFEKNVLVMEFIGEGLVAAPTARVKPPKDPVKWRDIIYQWVKDLWVNESLVHGDLSEYNLLNHAEMPVLIDIGQGVLKRHPLSLKLLKRDVSNITKWFNKLGVKDESLKEWYKKMVKK